VGWLVGEVVGLTVGKRVGFGVGIIVGAIDGLVVGGLVGVSVGGESEHKDDLRVEHHCPALQISLSPPSSHKQSAPMIAD